MCWENFNELTKSEGRIEHYSQFEKITSHQNSLNVKNLL